MTEIKLYKSSLKSLRLLVLSSIFVIPSIFSIITEKQTKFIVWFCFLFSGIAFLISIFNIFDKRVQIIINEIGIWDRSINQEIIKWEFIKNAYKIELHKQVFISIKTDRKFLMKKKVYKWASFLNKAFQAQNININFSYINDDIENIITLINSLKYEDIQQREKLIQIYKTK